MNVPFHPVDTEILQVATEWWPTLVLWTTYEHVKIVINSLHHLTELWPLACVWLTAKLCKNIHTAKTINPHASIT